MTVPTISIRGADGTVIPLSRPGEYRPDGLALMAVPEGLSGWGQDNQWEEYYGAAGAAFRGVRSGVEKLTLELQARGSDPRAHVNAVVDACSAGPVHFVVNTPDYGERFVEGRLQAVSKVRWYGGTAYEAALAELTLILDVGRPLWQCEPRRAELTPGNTTWGDIALETPGDQHFWPRFTITGRYANLRIRLNDGDEWQELPWSAGGWVVDSNPATRGVRTPGGDYSFAGLVPFWPVPVKVNNGEAVVQIIPVSAQADFKVVVDWTPEAKRAW